MEKFFTIKAPNDVYNAVGQIIKSSQELEKDYKQLASILKLKVRDIGQSSLNRINRKMLKQKLISEKDYENLEKVIDVRNRINHEFFLTVFDKKYDDYDSYLLEMENILNASHFVIFEATDLINNKLDNLLGDNINRPTIFDK